MFAMNFALLKIANGFNCINSRLDTDCLKKFSKPGYFIEKCSIISGVSIMAGLAPCTAINAN